MLSWFTTAAIMHMLHSAMMTQSGVGATVVHTHGTAANQTIEGIFLVSSQFYWIIFQKSWHKLAGNPLSEKREKKRKAVNLTQQAIAQPFQAMLAR